MHRDGIENSEFLRGRGVEEKVRLILLVCLYVNYLELRRPVVAER